jgi:hypothetical protein
MLSELIYEGSGKITGQRVLEVEAGIPKLETSISGNGMVQNRKSISRH